MKNPNVIPDLSGQQFGFTGPRLHRYSKPGINTWGYGRFTVKDYSGVNFAATNLSGCIFREVILNNADFRGANLANCEFRQVAVAHTSMSATNLRAATLILTLFHDVDFTDTVFGHSHFGYAPLDQCHQLQRTNHAAKNHIDFLTLWHSSQLPPEFLAPFDVDLDYYSQLSHLRTDLYRD